MKRIFLLLLMSCPLIVMPVAVAVPSTAHQTINPIMSKIGGIMVEIYPLIVAKRALSNDEINRLTKAIGELQVLFQEAKPFIDKKSEGYRVSYEFISGYLHVVQKVMNQANFDLTRGYLYALGEICTSCHTQDSTLRTLFSSSDRNRFDSDFDFAEFNYMTRNYPTAIEYYDKFLNSKDVDSELDVILPLQRIITIYVQVNSDPNAGITTLRKYVNLKAHTEETKQQLQEWIKGLEELRSNELKKGVLNFTQLKKYSELYLGKIDALTLDIDTDDKQEVLRVWLRGQLYHYLNSNPDEDQIPMILYWLAVADRSISYNYYFSMTDLYLKHCVLNYSGDNFAQRCLDEYQRFLDIVYSNNGDPLPMGIKEELRQLKNALEKAKKH